MIIDCHGHYTTAPGALGDWRKLQIAGKAPGALKISDDQIRDSLEGAQLRIQRERNTSATRR
jgi:4-oxalmesaconate hydratase